MANKTSPCFVSIMYFMHPLRVLFLSLDLSLLYICYTIYATCVAYNPFLNKIRQRGFQLLGGLFVCLAYWHNGIIGVAYQMAYFLVINSRELGI